MYFKAFVNDTGDPVQIYRTVETARFAVNLY